MKQFNTRTMVTTAILTAVSVAFYAFAFPVFGPIRMDFSDLPVMVAGSMLGFIPGIVVAFMKNLIHFMFLGSSTPILGEFANFSFAVLIMIPFALIKGKDWKHFLIKAVAAILLSSGGMFVINYFITLPLFGITDPAIRLAQLIAQYTPFNLIKGSILCVVYAVIKPQIDRMK